MGGSSFADGTVVKADTVLADYRRLYQTAEARRIRSTPERSPAGRG
jgi:hypothetical protein